MIWKKFEFLGLENTRIGDFFSIRFNLMKLACWIDSYDHYIELSILFNDQLVNFLKIVRVGFQIFGVFDINSMLKPIFVNLKLN